MKRNLSTFNEIKNRKDPMTGKIAILFDCFTSTIKEDTYILQFKDGSQANINHETLVKLSADNE